MRENVAFNFMATGVGSVPFLDVESACQQILELLPDIPFWPQFVKQTFLEDMSPQASERLPFIEINYEKKTLCLRSTEDKESELISFYEHFMAEDSDYFSIRPEFAVGLYKLIALIKKNSQDNGPFIKGQIVGPITFAGGLADKEGKSALYNNEILDTIVKGLAIKALWLVKRMSSTGKRPIIFLDEPSLSGFGSAFMSIRREKVIACIKEISDYLQTRTNALVGIHCCGNTDWPMIIETGVDIINFDAFDYMDYFLLYKKEIVNFLKAGGTIAWGVVPTVSYSGKETVNDLMAKLEKGVDQLCEWGIDKRTIAERSIITPACGLGSLEPDIAERIMLLLSRLARAVTDFRQQ